MPPAVRGQGVWANYQVPCAEYIPTYLVFCETWGELHRHAIFLSPDYGLLSAFLYGAVSRRNPMRATVQAFSFGQLNLRRGRRSGGSAHLQIADWQLESPSLLLSPPAPPSGMEVFQHAALWSELLLYSYGLGQVSAGPNPQAREGLLFAELRSLLSSILHFATAQHCQLATLRFCWQFLWLEGFSPGLEQCYDCNQKLASQTPFFSDGGQLLCPRCARGRSGGYLSTEEQVLLRWAQQDLAHFVRQQPLFFGAQSQHYGAVAQRLLSCLQHALQQVLGRQLCAFGSLVGGYS